MNKENQVLLIRQRDVDDFFELLDLFKNAASELLETSRVPFPYADIPLKPSVDEFYKR